MHLLQRDFRVFHHRAFSDFQLEKRRLQPGFAQDLRHLLIQLTTGEQTRRNVDRDERQHHPVLLPLAHLPARLRHDPGVDFCNQTGSFGDRNEFRRRHQAPLRVLPTHQRLDADQATALEVVNRLVIDPQLLSVQGAAQFEGDLEPLLGVGRQLFGVQGIIIAPRALGLEQCRVGIAQQLLDAQRIAGEQADADAGVYGQLVPINKERLFKALDDPLGQRSGLNQLRTAFGKYGELIPAQPRQGDARTEHGPQALGHSLEQLVANGMPEAVVDHLEVIEIDHQQRAATLMDLCRGQGLFGAVDEQQAVRQIGQRIVVRQVHQFVF
ncbi:hypothetical protein D3C73_551700 [compost metagenome]